ncbi:hypothetical protein ATCC90586_001731 [Pythium insidiosum]|nr:hypothetical protein ATCC90586_001731 [Pythium insidiosum]
MEATAYALMEHQREVFELARRHNVLLCSSRRIGKTCLAAMLMRDRREDAKLALAIAASAAERTALVQQLARVCSEPVWHDDRPEARDVATTAQQFLAATRSERDDGDRSTILTPQCRIAVMHASLFLYLLRKKLLAMQDISLLVVENMDDVHTAVPSLFRLAFARDDVGATSESTRIFATTSTPPSRLNLDPRRNELMGRVQVINISPVVSENATQILEGSRTPPFPALLPEVFDPNDVTASARLPPGVEVRDFLLGQNEKKVDLVRVFRNELQMGNSAAIYDERKKQDRVNKFIQEAEVVYRNLGFWCLIKFVELELQANLQACLVDDDERLKYTFQNKLLLLEAITHPSVGPFQIVFSDSREQPKMWRNNYERLEYLGDAVIEYLTLSYAFVRYDSWLPGSLSQWKSATVSNDALGKTALSFFGIDECMLIGSIKIDRESLSVPQGFVPSVQPPRKDAVRPNMLSLPKMFADVFEALVAAVFLDSGHDLQVVRDVFMGPLMATVSNDAYIYVCRESGLPTGNEQDMDELMLLSDDDDD